MAYQYADEITYPDDDIEIASDTRLEYAQYGMQSDGRQPGTNVTEFHPVHSSGNNSMSSQTSHNPANHLSGQQLPLPSAATTTLSHSSQSVQNASSQLQVPKQKLLSKQFKKGPYRRAEDGHVLNFNNLLCTKPDFVQELRSKYMYTDQQCSFIVQYFLQIVMVYPSEEQIMVKEIFQARTDEIISSGRCQLLHPLDPLRMFQYCQPQGVPPTNFVLCDSGVVPYNQGYHFTKAATAFQIPGYPPNRQPLPIGITLHEIARDYPNHCCYEFLDCFMQHGIPAGSVVRAMQQDALDKMEHLNITHTHRNMMTNRFRARKETLVSMVSCDAVGLKKLEAYIGSEFQIFQLGRAIKPQYSMKAGASNHTEFKTLRKIVTDADSEAHQNDAHDDLQSTTIPRISPQPSTAPVILSSSVAGHPTQSRDDRPGSQSAVAKPTSSQGNLTPPQQSTQASTPLIFDCRPSQLHRLGHFGEEDFWSSFEEYQGFMLGIVQHRQNQLRFLEWVIVHDPMERDNHGMDKATYRSLLVRRLRDIISATLKQENVYTVENKADVALHPNHICTELDEHIRNCLRSMENSSLTKLLPTSELAQNAKTRTVTMMLTSDTLLTQLLATKVSHIIQGDRTSLFQDENLALKVAQTQQLCRVSSSALQAQTANKANMFELFYSSDILVNAILATTSAAAQAQLEPGFSPREWASEMLVQAQDQLSALNLGDASDQAYNKLDEALRNAAVTVLEKISGIAKYYSLGRTATGSCSQPESLAKRKRDDDVSNADELVSKQARISVDLRDVPALTVRKVSSMNGGGVVAPHNLTALTAEAEPLKSRIETPRPLKNAPQKRKVDELIETGPEGEHFKRSRLDSGYGDSISPSTFSLSETTSSPSTPAAVVIGNGSQHELQLRPEVGEIQAHDHDELDKLFGNNGAKQTEADRHEGEGSYQAGEMLSDEEISAWTRGIEQQHMLDDGWFREVDDAEFEELLTDDGLWR